MSNKKAAAKKAAPRKAAKKAAPRKSAPKAAKPSSPEAAPTRSINWDIPGEHWTEPGKKLHNVCEQHHMGKIDSFTYREHIQPLKERFDQGGRSEGMYNAINDLAKKFLK